MVNMVNQEDEYNSKTQLEIVSAKLDQPHKFAKIFCEAAESQTSIQEVFQKITNKLINNNPEIRKSLEEHQKQVNKSDYLYVIMKGLGFFKQVILLVIAAGIGYVFKKYF